jgi:hypothetical protein
MPAVNTLFTGTARDIMRALVIVQDGVRIVLRHAIRLIASGVRKNLSAIGLDGDRFLDAVEPVFGRAQTWFMELVNDASEAMMGTVVRRKRSEEKIAEIVARAAPVLRASPPAELGNSFTRLNMSFDEKQRRALRVAGVVQMGGPLLLVLQPPFGAAALLATVLVGCSYVLIGLADRLDTSSAPLPHRTQGVPTILRAELGV